MGFMSRWNEVVSVVYMAVCQLISYLLAMAEAYPTSLKHYMINSIINVKMHVNI